MKHNIFLILFIITSLLYGQDNAGAISGAPRQYMGTFQAFQKIRKLLNENENSNSIKFSDIKGSPYLNNEFEPGNIYIKDSLIEKGMLRYNIYADEIEIKDQQKLFGLYKIQDSKVKIGKDEIILKEFFEDQKKEKGYFITLINSNKVKLYKRIRCKIIEPLKAATPNQKDRSAKFKSYIDYYIILPIHKNGQLSKIKLKKKSIMNLMQDQEEKIKGYFKKNQVNLKREKDITKLFSYYESIDI